MPTRWVERSASQPAPQVSPDAVAGEAGRREGNLGSVLARRARIETVSARFEVGTEVGRDRMKAMGVYMLGNAAEAKVRKLGELDVAAAEVSQDINRFVAGHFGKYRNVYDSYEEPITQTGPHDEAATPPITITRKRIIETIDGHGSVPLRNGTDVEGRLMVQRITYPHRPIDAEDRTEYIAVLGDHDFTPEHTRELTPDISVMGAQELFLRLNNTFEAMIKAMGGTILPTGEPSSEYSPHIGEHEKIVEDLIAKMKQLP